jgi:N-methylhydantoinase B/oxoprolinase/acetone carboxylase alpha subunit
MALEQDPVAIEVLRGRLQSIADEMEFVLLKSSYSSIVTEALDATCAVFDRHGMTTAQACAIPVHLGVLAELGRSFARQYPQGEAQPGDVYIINDPYAGGTHLPDIAVAAPVFHNERVTGYVASMVHHQDLGGSAPGSTSASAYDHFAEGLRIPLIRIVNRGEPNNDVIDLIIASSRSPTNVRGDLNAQIAACRTGERRLQALYRDAGGESVDTGIDALMGYAERLTRLAIERIPDGSYDFEDWLDDDGLDPDSDPRRIYVRISVSGSDIEFDFTGSDPQVDAAINSVRSSTLAVVYYAVRVLTGDAAPNNDGCYRPVSVVLPEGSLVNATLPAPVNARMVTVHRIGDTVMGAMSKAVPERIAAAGCGQTSVIPVGGSDPDTGVRFVGVLGGPYRGGMGARPDKDGIDVTDHDICNVYHVPIEMTESELPVLYRVLELWTDSGGAGRWRGGLGYHAELEWRADDSTVSLRRERHKFGPWGAAGGGGAPSCRTEIISSDGQRHVLPGKILAPIRNGDRLNYWTTGGGGYGSPLTREPERVLDDVLDGRVSVDAAREIYAVVVDSGRLDREQTEKMRGH